MKKGSAIILIMAITAAVAVLIGSGVLEGIWPAGNISPQARQYAGQDPNLSKAMWTNMGDLKKTKQAIEMQFFVAKSDLTAALNKNEGLHTIFAGEVNTNLEKSQALYQQAIGTKDSPGWAMVGVGSLLTYLATKKWGESVNYTEAEVTEIVKNGNSKTVS